MNRLTSLYLDVVRLTAAMIVFLGHSSGQAFTGGLFWQLGTYLQTAVIMFFVLSGYVIAFVTDTKEKKLSDYSIARISRLLSVVIPALFITAICDYIGLQIDPSFYIDGPWGYPEGNQVLNYILSFFLIQNLHGLALNPGINGPFWSLSFEFAYYFIFAAALFLTGIKRFAIIVLALLISGPAIVALFPIWLMGYFLYFLHKSNKPFINQYIEIAISITCLLLLIFASPWVRDNFTFAFYGRYLIADYFEAIVFTLHLLFVPSLLIKLGHILEACSSFIRWTASLTFALYLFHRPLIQLFVLISPEEPSSWLTRAIVLLGTLIIIITLGRWSEKQKYTIKRLITPLFK